jgi:acyl-CoA synthetase (AMP-forming)/AMP-acid ligase II
MTAIDHPDAPAIGSKADEIDFRTLDARVNQVANGLGTAGEVGDRVAILGRNSAEQVELLLGCARARQVALPINWRLSAPEIGYILEHSGARRIFVDSTFAETVEAALSGNGVPIHLLDGIGERDFAAWRDRQDDVVVTQRGAPDDIVLQMYTSGTTGLPKGVLLSNANVMASVEIFSQGALHLAPGDVIYAPAPMFHITGIGPVLRCAQSGARLVLSRVFDPDEAVRLMSRERVTYTTLAPAMIQACLASPELDTVDLGALRLIVYGGSPISEAVLREARARVGCEFAQCYGLTETTGPITLLTPEDHRPGRDKLASCGRAAGDIAIMIADRDGAPLPVGETGEILVRGSVVMAGYASDAQATAATMADDWLRTGDAGYVDDQGYLFIRDRVKDMIVSGGENIYPVEVENALQAHPAVADVAVIGVPDQRWGEAVMALVVPADEGASMEAILAFCRDRIAGYKCPKEIRFTDVILRNAAGKILRREIRKPFWEGMARLVG